MLVVFKNKIKFEGSKALDAYGIHRHKTRGVTFDYEQIPGINYTKSHSSVTNDILAKIAFEITLYHHLDWDIHDIGTEAAFLGDKPMYTEWLFEMAETVLISQEDTESTCVYSPVICMGMCKRDLHPFCNTANT